MLDILETHINPALWIVSNITLFYICVALLSYVVVYGVRFRWREYEGGRLIFAFTLSLLGIVALVFVGVFINPQRNYWYVAPDDVLWWRPAARLAVYYAVAMTLTNMNRTLWRRLRDRSALEVTVPVREREGR